MKAFPSLDSMDIQILRLLRKNARISNKELADKIGLAQSSCLERVRRLRLARVLTGFHADVDPDAIGIGLQAMVAVRLTRHSRGEVESFQRHLEALPEVVTIFHVAGANDYLVHVAVRDASHLRELALSAFTERPEVAHIETQLIFQHTRNHDLPLYLQLDEE
ncbi:MAG: Lrp/AsnC family transcriptional regulator [Wenzhouxiangella sp.]|nr:Lrp/AsnC family transcriptional regulator [Wenzhouxiangella sp.]MCH8479609.1 Lrp/AsnC family transcriptional regulator [Wenzhouxiangella sp.]TVR95865.1 MAG: Lrp/AsnC family transcriptional regulator [Wenzhouxiangellaceae bacterium]